MGVRLQFTWPKAYYAATDTKRTPGHREDRVGQDLVPVLLVRKSRTESEVSRDFGSQQTEKDTTVSRDGETESAGFLTHSQCATNALS